MKNSVFHQRARFFLVTLLLAGTTHVAAGQNTEDAFRYSYRDPAVGPRMIGLAGASHAGVADWSALVSNPAGLGYFERSAVSLGLKYADVSNDVTSVSEGVTPDNSGGTVTSNNASHTDLSYVYRVPTIQGSFVLAVGYSQVASFTRDLRYSGQNYRSTITTSFLPFAGEYSLDDQNNLSELDNLPFAAFNGGFIEFYPEFLDDNPEAYPFLEAVVPGSRIDQHLRVMESGGLSEVSFGGAMEISRGVMLGLSLNIPFGEYHFRSEFEEIDTYNENNADDYSVAQDDGSFLEGFDRLSYRQRLRSDIVGINARLGVSAELLKQIRIGFTIETPTAYSVEESYGAEYMTQFDDGGLLRYGERSDDVGSGSFAYEILSPTRLSVGIRYTWGPVTAFADLERVGWNEVRFSAKSDQVFFDALNQNIDVEWSADRLNKRLGIELQFGRFDIRAGAASYPHPHAYLSSSEGSPLQINRDRDYGSFGLGYRMNKHLQFDLAWFQTSYESGYVAYPEDDLGQRQKYTVQIDEAVTDRRFIVGATYLF